MLTRDITVNYLDRHRGDLQRLFAALGKGDQLPAGDAELEAHLLARWLGDEHGASVSKEQYTPAQEAAARPLLPHLDVVERVDPRPGTHYDEILVMGASGIGLHRRLELVRTSGVSADRLTVLAGLRPHEGNARDGDIDELLSVAGRMAAAAGWRPPPDLLRRAALLRDQGVDPFTIARVLVPTETDLATLLLVKQWPGAHSTDMLYPDRPHALENELGQREFVLRAWSTTGPIPELRLLNGAPVDRGNRPARPTSTSTVLEWLELPGTGEVSRVLIVVNQPHLYRVGLELGELVRGRGHDLIIDVAGREAAPDAALHLLLGEVAARISLERRLTSA